jgi:hypothetical protein
LVTVEQMHGDEVEYEPYHFSVYNTKTLQRIQRFQAPPNVYRARQLSCIDSRLALSNDEAIYVYRLDSTSGNFLTRFPQKLLVVKARHSLRRHHSSSMPQCLMRQLCSISHLKKALKLSLSSFAVHDCDDCGD